MAGVAAMSAESRRAAGVISVAGLESFLSREAQEVAEDLEAFAALLYKWQQVQNLVSRETLPHLWVRHMRDSLQLLKNIVPKERRFLDLGSGGGFPAIPLAIALKSSDLQFHLVESNRRKASFLRMVARELELPVRVFDKRIEQVGHQEIGEIDLVTCRATTSLCRLFGLVAPFWGNGTKGLFHKGREYGEELVKAGAVWRFNVVELMSETDRDGRILEISNLARGVLTRII